MKKARIENSEVVEILIADPFPDFHPALIWVEAPEYVEPRWRYQDSHFLPPPEPPAEDIQRLYTDALQRALDQTAQARGYDNALSCISYRDSAVTAFAAEARAMCAWRDVVWSWAYGELAAIQTGAKGLPELSDFVAAMPAMAWPEISG